MEGRELVRKLVHLSGIVFPLGLLLLPRRSFFILFTGFFLFYLILEILRLTSRSVGGFFERFLGRFMRESEKRGIATSTYYMVGIYLVFLLFERDIAAVSMMILVVSDVAASIFGNLFGRTRVRSKTLEGSLFFFITSLAVSLPFFPLKKCLLVSLATSLVELFVPGRYDNFFIPMVSAILLKFL